VLSGCQYLKVDDDMTKAGIMQDDQVLSWCAEDGAIFSSGFGSLNKEMLVLNNIENAIFIMPF
jgi:hypothetical protein